MKKCDRTLMLPRSTTTHENRIYKATRSGGSSHAEKEPRLTIDTASRPDYNTLARFGYLLTTSMLAEQGPAHAAHAFLSIRNTSSDAMPPRLRPFFGEAATPDSHLMCSPAGDISLVHSFPGILYLQRACVFAKLTSAPLVTTPHASTTGIRM